MLTFKKILQESPYGDGDEDVQGIYVAHISSRSGHTQQQAWRNEQYDEIEFDDLNKLNDPNSELSYQLEQHANLGHVRSAFFTGDKKQLYVNGGDEGSGFENTPGYGFEITIERKDSAPFSSEEINIAKQSLPIK